MNHSEPNNTDLETPSTFDKTGRRVLIVSPRFPPVNAPDYNRIRVALPYLESCGYIATILCVSPKDIDREQDPELLCTIPKHIKIEVVSAPATLVTRALGIRGLAWRCLLPLYRRGCELLRDQQFDLIYFSTTVFITFALGRLWKRRFGVPYIVDYQDPWRNDYYSRTGTPPPGGPLRHAVASATAAILEPYSLRCVAGLTSVSPNYVEQLRKRYPFLPPERCLNLPFGASTEDFVALKGLAVRNTFFDPDDPCEHWCYVGRVDADMHHALRGFFQAVSECLNESRETWARIRIHLIGTSYASANSNDSGVRALAAEFGIAEIVQEQRERVSHFEFLKIVQDCDLFFIPGSDDPSYFASKIFQVLFAEKPVLAIFHSDGPAYATLKKLRVPYLCGFNPQEAPQTLSKEIRTLLQELRRTTEQDSMPDTELQPYSAEQMTVKLCQFFDKVLRV